MCVTTRGVRNAIYLDHNATTPIDPEILAKVPEWLSSWGNPSSIHWAGRGPKAILREARLRVAQLLGVEPLELIFTSGGSEANNLALKGLAQSHATRRQIILSSVEHPSLRKTAEYLRAQGFAIDFVKVDREGQLDLEELARLLSERTLLVSVMTANNETGHVMPIAEVARLAHAHGALVHTDAVQALGKLPFRPRELGVDMASLSGHKFYGLKGCGVLYVRKGLSLQSLIHGGGQERGRRAGTENLPSIASLGLMCTRAAEVEARAVGVRELRDHLEARILREIEGVTITGPRGLRLANTSSLTLRDVDGETLLMNLDVAGFAVSTGAACAAGNPEPSPTLLAMGFTREEAQSSLRVSLGWRNTREEIDLFVDALVKVVARLRHFREQEFARGHGFENEYSAQRPPQKHSVNL